MNTSRARLFSRLGIALAFVMTAISPLAHASPSAPVASATEAEAALKKFAAAWEKEDLGTAMGLFSADALVLDPAPPGVFATPEAIKGWVSGAFQAMDHISITITGMKTRVSGGMACITAHYIFKGMIGANAVGDEGNLSSCWMKQDDGSYQMTVFHASIPPPPPAPAK